MLQLEMNSNSNLNMNQKKYENYTKIKLLGEGSFGKAYLVQCESDKVIMENFYILEQMRN